MKKVFIILVTLTFLEPSFAQYSKDVVRCELLLDGNVKALFTLREDMKGFIVNPTFTCEVKAIGIKKYKRSEEIYITLERTYCSKGTKYRFTKQGFFTFWPEANSHRGKLNLIYGLDSLNCSRMTTVPEYPKKWLSKTTY